MTELCENVIELTPFTFYPWSGGDSFDGNSGTAFGGTFHPWVDGDSLNGGITGYYEPSLEIDLPFFTIYPWNDTPAIDGGETSPWGSTPNISGGGFSPWGDGANVNGGTSGNYTPNLEIEISL